MKQTASHLVLGMLALLTAGCAERPAGSVSVGAAVAQAAPAVPFKLPPGKPVRVLFIGNSLTAANNLPALVQAMAASGKVRLEYEACTPGGVNLQDHWSDGRCRKLLAGGNWDYVVLQQGPSSLPENRANLGEWAREVGGGDTPVQGQARALHGVAVPEAEGWVWPGDRFVSRRSRGCRGYPTPGG